MFIKRRINYVGQEKTISKFLLFPRFTKHTIAWMCRVNLTYRYGYDGFNLKWHLKYIEKM